MSVAGNRIGGGVSKLRYAVIFAVGVVVGTIIRAGMWVLPSGLVDSITSRLGSE